MTLQRDIVTGVSEYNEDISTGASRRTTTNL